MAATATVTSRTSTFVPAQNLGSAVKANSPYGLPIVDNCQSCALRGSGFFCELARQTLDDLDDIKHTTSYPEGALVFMEGQAARGVFIVCQGKVKLVATSPEGKSFILRIAQAGEVLGTHSVISGRPHELTAETLQPSQLAFISREHFLRFLQGHGDACLQLAQHLGRDCQSAYEVIRSIGLSHSVQEKMARLMLHWAEEGTVVDSAIRVRLTLTHEEIAQLIGASRETVTRVMGEFRKRKLIEVNGSSLVIRNHAALEKLAVG